MSVPISSQLSRTLDVARSADMPVLLRGTHGIGKSEFLLDYANARGISAKVLDLSLLEATDLTGIPYIEDGSTRFAPPLLLPEQGVGEPTMLVLEELNRCDRSVRQPCLQLLTARKLNEYELPKDCFLVACVNPEGEDYQVDILDPALISRFLVLDVEPDIPSWLRWARKNELFSGVVRFINKFPQSFDRAAPRAWTYAARLLESAFGQGWTLEECEPLLEPILGSIATQALMAELPNKLPNIPPEKLLAHPSQYLEQFEAWSTQKRTDIFSFLLENLRQHIENNGRAIPEEKRDELFLLLDLVPADLGLPIIDALERRQRAA